MSHDSVLIAALANRGYGIAKTALPNHPPRVCVALLSRRLKSATWLPYIQSAGRCTVWHFAHARPVMLSTSLVTLHADLVRAYGHTYYGYNIYGTVRVYFSEDTFSTAITHASTFSLCVGGSSSSDSEESQGGAATATSLLDAPKLSQLGIMKFFPA